MKKIIKIHSENVIYTHSSEYYLTIKKNEIAEIEEKWMDLGKIVVSEVTLTQKEKQHIFSPLWFLAWNPLM